MDARFLVSWIVLIAGLLPNAAHADCTMSATDVAPHQRTSFVEGGLVYDTAAKALKTCDGTNWATVGGGSVLKSTINTSAPATCDASTDGTIALASNYTACVCRNGTGWVTLASGSTACTWATGVSNVTSATYGVGCSGVSTGNVNAWVSSYCIGKMTCTFQNNHSVSYGGISDPAYGCVKKFSASYQCSQGSSKSVSMIAENGTVTFTCP